MTFFLIAMFPPIRTAALVAFQLDQFEVSAAHLQLLEDAGAYSLASGRVETS